MKQIEDFIKLVIKIQKILLSLIIFLMPSQLSYHLWPNWSYIFGLRVDYLSTTIYLTELLIFLLLFSWFLEIIYQRLRGINSNLFRKRDLQITALLIGFSLLNILSSSYPLATAISWLKFYIILLFALYLTKLKRPDFRKWFLRPLYYSLIFFALIGIAQFIKRGSVGGIFYYFGERSFSVDTPGIALSNFFGREYLRPYSTFPHPNAFAGYYLVGLLFLFACSKRIRLGPKNFLLLSLSALVFAIAFSKSVFLAMGVILFFGFLFRQKVPSRKILNYLLVFSFLISLLAPVFTARFKILNFGIFSNKSVKERVELLNTTGIILKDNRFFGVGKNMFIKEIPAVYYGNKISWILQPVHNVYLLLFTELGIFGLISSFLFLLILIKKIYETKNILLVFLLLAVLTTALFDHYWYTLEQNQLLLAVIFGILFNKKYLLEFKKS